MIHKCHQRRGGTRQQLQTGRDNRKRALILLVDRIKHGLQQNPAERPAVKNIQWDTRNRDRDREGKNEEESQQQGAPLTTLPVKSLMSKPWADNQDCGLSHGFISMPILSRNKVLCQGPMCSFYAIRTAALIKWLNKDFEKIFHWGKTWKNTLKSKLKARLTVSLPCPDGFL